MNRTTSVFLCQVSKVLFKKFYLYTVTVLAALFSWVKYTDKIQHISFSSCISLGYFLIKLAHVHYKYCSVNLHLITSYQLINQNWIPHTSKYRLISYQFLRHLIKHILNFCSSFSSCADLLLTKCPQSDWTDISQLLQLNSLKLMARFSQSVFYWISSNIYNHIKEVVLYLLRLVNIFSTTLNDLLTNKTAVIFHQSGWLSLKMKKQLEFCLYWWSGIK